MQFQFGWIADPLYFGDYPAVMRNSQPKLPKFKDSEKKLLAGSTDFLAVNYYTSHFVAAVPAGAPKSQVQPGSGSLRRVDSNHCPMQHIARRMLPAGESKLANMAVLCSCCCMVVWRHASNGCSFSWLCVEPQHLLATCCVLQLYEEALQDASGNYPGPATDVFWQFSTPNGLQSLLAWVSKRYQRPELWVAENGMAVAGEANMTREAALDDGARVDFFRCEVCLLAEGWARWSVVLCDECRRGENGQLCFHLCTRALDAIVSAYRTP